MEGFKKSQENPEEPIDLSDLFKEVLSTPITTRRKQVNKASTCKSTTSVDEIDADKRNVEFVCNACGDKVTYKEFYKHKNTEKHRSAYEKLIRTNRKERKIRTRQKKRSESTKDESKSTTVARGLSSISETTTRNLQDKGKVKETYHLRRGNPLPEQHQLYIVTLSTYFALQLSFGKDNRDFRISIINSDWNEFGDIVIEFCVYGSVDEIQAVQCKQVQTRSNIQVSTLAAEMGKFSIKTRCDILKQLKRKKNNYDKAYFKLFTVSSLQVHKDDVAKFVYDDDAIKQWKSKKDKAVWKDKELKIPEYKKMHLLNTTDDPDDICIFKIVDSDNRQVIDDLNKFSMFTNQRKLDGLKKVVKAKLRSKFDNCEDISDELIDYVSKYFNQNQTCKKLSRCNFLLTIGELLLRPYFKFPKNVTDTINLPKWSRTLKNFDLTIIRNQRGMEEKIYKCFSCILQEETKFTERDDKLIIEKVNLSDEKLSSVIFEEYEDTVELTLPQAYLALWQAKFVPLVLVMKNENDLNIISNIVTFLYEEDICLKFIVITDIEVDIEIFPKNLKIFCSLKDLQNKETHTILDDLKNSIEIQVCGVNVFLREIVENNPHFLENNYPDVLLNMLLGEYSLRYVDTSMEHDVIVDDPLVLSMRDMGVMQSNFRDDDDEIKGKDFAYVVNVNGKPGYIKVPPML